MVSCINGILLRFIGFSSPVFKSQSCCSYTFCNLKKMVMFELLVTLLTEFLRTAHGTVHSCYNTLEFVVALSLNAFFICFSQSSSGVRPLAMY